MLNFIGEGIHESTDGVLWEDLLLQKGTLCSPWELLSSPLGRG